MDSLTKAVKPPKVKVAQITQDFVLPRPVELVKILGTGVGAIFAMALVAIAPVPMGMMSMAFALTLGGGLGFAATVYSPMRGANIAQWALLKMRRRNRRVELDGKHLHLAVGICRVKGMTLGTVHLAPSTVEVLPGSVDERGASTVDVSRSEVFAGSADLVEPDVALSEKAVDLSGTETPAPAGGLGSRLAAIRAASATPAESLNDSVEAARTESSRDEAGFVTPSS